MCADTLNVLIDDEAFIRHSRSGITRYFAELVQEFGADPSLGVRPVTPYRFVANQHLTELAGSRFRRLVLPPQVRPRVLRATNAWSRARMKSRIDLVHHSLYLPDSLISGPDSPRVATIYDFTLELYPELFPGWASGLDDKNLYIEQCAGLLCISHTTRDDLARFHPALDKPVEVTPLGVSDAFFAATTRPVPGVAGRYVLFVGNRHANKNVDPLFVAFSRIAQTDPDLRLVLCGNPLFEPESARLAELGIAHRTTCLRVSDEALPRLYANAEAFVFPSRYEGFGLPVVEAMASGCPVVAARIPALVEVGDDAGRYFDPDDVDELTTLLEKVIGDRALRADMTEAGRARAREYSWRRTARATADAYRRIIAETR